MFKLIFPTLKVYVINYYYDSHQNGKVNYLIFIEQPRIFDFLTL